MEINWYGHSCFRISERSKASVVMDPYDHKIIGYESLKLKSDIVTVSKEDAGHNYIKGVKGSPYLITGPGEFEIGGVFITGIQTNGKRNKKEGELRNNLFLIDYDGVTIAHLGEMNKVPSQSEIEALGHVNIALVPVGGVSSLNAAKAAEVISLLEPNIVIPMHYATPDLIGKLDPLNKFLKEMGLVEVETTPSFKVNNISNLPEETRVIVLDYK